MSFNHTLTYASPVEVITESKYQIGGGGLRSDANGDLICSIGKRNLCAFGEINNCELTPIIQHTFPYNVNDRFFIKELPEGASDDVVNSTLRLKTGTGPNIQASIRSKKAIRYRAGQGIRARFTAVFINSAATATSYIGIGHIDDGFFFGYVGTTFGILYRSEASGAIVDTFIPEADWNGQTVNFNKDKGNVYQIQFQYLGFGEINFSIEEQNTGEFVVVHTIRYANTSIYPSLKNATLPYYLFVDNGTSGVDIELRSASCGFFVEGKSKINGLPNAISNEKTGIATTETNILTIRNKEFFPISPSHNHSEIYPNIIKLVATGGTRPAKIRILLNTTLGGVPSFTDIDTNTSCVDYDVAGTTVSGGYVIAEDIVPKDGYTTIDLGKINAFLDREDTLTIAAQTSSGTIDIYASINWVEDI